MMIMILWCIYVDPSLLSNVLQLQKFLTDRGHVVDILQ